MMQKRIIAISILLFFVLLGGFVLYFHADVKAASDKAASFTLSEQEKNLVDAIKKHTITIGYRTGCEYKSNDGIGYLTVIKDFLEQELDLTVQMKQVSEWNQLLEDMERKKLDFIMMPKELVNTQAGWYVSESVLALPLMYLSSERGNIRDDSDQVIGVWSGDSSKELIKESGYPGTRVTEYDSLIQLKEAVEEGILDGAVLSYEQAMALVGQSSLWGTKWNKELYQVFVTGNKENEPIITLLNRYLNETEEGELSRELMFEQVQKVLWSDYVTIYKEKRKELKEKYPSINYTIDDLDNMPFCYEQDGKNKGTVWEDFKNLEQYLGIPMKYKKAEQPKEALLNGETMLWLTAELYQDSQSKLLRGQALTKEAFLLCENKKNQTDYIGITKELKNYYDPNAYYGLAEMYQENGNSTPHGNLIIYDTGEEMLSAFETGKISQMILKEGNIANQELQNSEEPVSKLIANSRITNLGKTVSEGFYVSSENRLLMELVNEVFRYQSYLGIDRSEQGSTLVLEYRRKAVEEKQVLHKRMLQGGIVIMGILVAAGAIFYYLLRRGVWNKAALLGLEKDGRANTSQAVDEGGMESKSLVARYRARSMKGDDNTDSSGDENRDNQLVDPLTGLWTRNIFQDKICEIVEQCPDSLGVFAFIDMDRLKKINSYFGREAGDAILKQLAFSLKQMTSEDNRVAFRMGGDDFGIFCGGMEDEKQIQAICVKLRDLNLQVNMDGERITANYSVGVSIFNKDAYSLLELMECADQAMGVCKENGLKLSYYRKK